MIERLQFGEVDGQQVELFVLRNGSGMEVKITNYGGIITSIKVKNSSGSFTDVVLGYDKLDSYLRDNPYFGCLVGRYANRIADGKFTLEGKEYVLAKNDGPNHLHGGVKGFDKVVWEPEPVAHENGVGLCLRYLSRDGEEGFPGNLNVAVTYQLNEENELSIDYQATTDKKTIICLTQHSYFNLSGEGDILDHVLQLNASKYTPVNSVYIPTGEMADVTGTQLDFTQPGRIGDAVSVSDRHMLEGGFDHNFVLDGSPGELKMAAVVDEKSSGIRMTMKTTEPAVQFYTGNFLDGSHVGKQGQKYEKHAGFCLEAQCFPDSPNKPEFPAVILAPGETYRQKTVYGFGFMD